MNNQRPGIPAPAPLPTFAEAESAAKPFSDNFIVNALSNKLETIPGQSAYFLKNFMDQVPPDQSDIEFMTSADKLVGFRNDLSDFISDNLQFTAPVRPPEDVRNYLIRRKQAFKDQLVTDKQTVGTWVTRYVSGIREKYPRQPFQFQGMTVEMSTGSVDLLEKNAGDVRANITVQRQGIGLFVMWSSANYVRAAAQKAKPDVTRRIYLNPRSEESVKVFSEVTQAADAAGLSVKAKICDRTLESVSGSKVKDGKANTGIRGDGIVLYASTEEAERLLSIVGEVYERHYETAFEGRRTSRIPLRIADGVSIGDEPTMAKSSLTEHRSGVINTVLHKVLENVTSDQLKVDPAKREDAVRAFRIMWREAATNSGINPDNLAFNRK